MYLRAEVEAGWTVDPLCICAGFSSGYLGFEGVTQPPIINQLNLYFYKFPTLKEWSSLRSFKSKSLRKRFLGGLGNKSDTEGWARSIGHEGEGSSVERVLICFFVRTKSDLFTYSIG